MYTMIKDQKDMRDGVHGTRTDLSGEKSMGVQIKKTIMESL